MSKPERRARSASRKRPRQIELTFIPGLPSLPADSLAEHYETAKGTIGAQGVSPRQFAVDVTYAARRLRK